MDWEEDNAQGQPDTTNIHHGGVRIIGGMEGKAKKHIILGINSI
jgi:hypothetical protein